MGASRVRILNSEEPITPFWGERTIPILMTSSSLFLPYAGVAIQSLLRHTSILHQYEIYLLNTGYSSEEIFCLEKILENHSNVILALFDVQIFLQSLKLKTLGHIGVETYCRLLAPRLFVNYPKLIYLDSDLVVCRDVALLMEIEMQSALIAGVVDVDVVAQCWQPNSAMRTYCEDVLQLQSPQSYIQTGVLILNIQEIQKEIDGRDWFEFAAGKKLLFADQDILNHLCQQRTKLLNMRWNVVTDCGGYRVPHIIAMGAPTMYEQYMCSREDPYIVHYSGKEKPWDNPTADVAALFWEYAMQTPFYAELCHRLENKQHTTPSVRQQIKALTKRLICRLLPHHTRRREFVRAWYYKMVCHM